MTYVPKDWTNDVTYADEAAMDHIEQGIHDAHLRIDTIPKGDTGDQGPTGETGPPGAVLVYEQADAPATTEVGSLWIETDAAVMYGPMWMQLTQAQYDALSPPDPNYLYIIVG